MVEPTILPVIRVELPGDEQEHPTVRSLRAEVGWLRANLHVAHGALLCIGTDYSKEVADHLAAVLDPALTRKKPA